MRKLSFALIASLCFMGISSAASATSVNMVWTGTTGGVIVSGNSVTLAPSSVATLTLDVVLDVDSRGAAGVTINVAFDSDLGNELNLISQENISWSNMSGSMTLGPISGMNGVGSSQESFTGTQEGQINDWAHGTLADGPASTTLTFARIVFATNHGNVVSDGNDIFSGGLIGGNAAGSTIFDAVYNGASVNLVPEPGTVALLGLGIGSLALAGRRRGRK